jgi:choline dehydrogenase-like flavoprotein
LADDLADRGAKVLLLEAGSLLFPTHIYNLPGSWDPLKDQYFVYQHELAPGSTFEGGVKVNFGGGSVFWSGIIQEANEWEFGSAWPVSVLRYLLHEGGYARATQLMRRQLTRGPYEDELVARLSARFPEHRVRRLPRARHQPHLTELPDGRVVLQNVIRESNGMFSTVDLLSDSLSYPGAAGNENLTVNLNHMVTRIETEGRRAVGVVCEDLLSNTRRRYSARFVVLAAGSLGSTRIALQSALSDPGGLIGKGLSDHPNFSIRTEWPLREAPIGREDHAKLMLQHNAASHGQQPFNIEVLVNYQYWDRRVADEDVWRQQIVQPMDRIGMDVQFFFPSALDEGNHVSLNADSRKLSVFTGENTSGLVHRDEVRAVADALLAEIGGGVTPSYSGDLRYFRAAQIGHLGGTLRMGAAGSGVVDETQRFHGYDNLYVADLSAFPSILAAKPTLTLAALSLRLADTLIDQLPHLSGDPNRRGIRSRIAMVAPGFA